MQNQSQLKQNIAKIYKIDAYKAIIIDIVRPIGKISFNQFNTFNILTMNVIINNSMVKTKSKLINKIINPNQNYDSNNDKADTIIFTLSLNSSISNIASFEVLGGINNLIFINPNGIIINGGRFINISKLTFVSGLYDFFSPNKYIISGEISILSAKNNLGIDASEVDELHLIARKINISGETIVKGLLSIETRIDKQFETNTRPIFSFQTYEFGNIQAGSIILTTLEYNTNVKITTSIIATMNVVKFNLIQNLILKGNAAKLISERSTLTIKAVNLMLDNKALISSKKDMILCFYHDLFNKNKSIIHTEIGGNIKLRFRELKNYKASIIQSGSNLDIRGKTIQNIGLNIGKTYVKEFQKTGKKATWYNIVPYGADKVDVYLINEPSQILAENLISINVDNLQNISSNIISMKKLIINGRILNNERMSFNTDIKYETQEDYKTNELMIVFKRWYPEIYKRHRQYIKNYYNSELFYSNTPSLIIGDIIEINLIGMLTQDSKRIHKDKDFIQSGSRIESNNELFIKAKNIQNNGIIISSSGKETIIIDEELRNLGGIIVSKKGGIIKTFKLINEALVRIFSADGTIFSEMVQPAAIGVSENPNNLSITYQKSDDNSLNQNNIMVIQAQEVENIGSYLINNEGTIHIIANKFKSVTKEVRNRIKESGTLIDITNNYLASIVSNNIDLSIAETLEISGTHLNATQSIKLKARKLSINDIKNKEIEEHTIIKKSVFSKSKYHGMSSKTQSIQSKINAPKIDIKADDDVNMYAPIINGNDISIISKKGNINIEGVVDETKKQLEIKEKGFAGFTGNVGKDGISIGTKFKLDIFQESKLDKNIVFPILIAKNNLTIKSQKNTKAKSASINGNNICIEANNGDINVESMQESHQAEILHENLITSINYRIGNSYVDSINSSLAASENIKQTQHALKNLNSIRKQFEQGKVSEKALKNAEMSLALLSANAGMSSMQITKALANAAQTTLIGGMYATIDVHEQCLKETSELNNVINKQSSICGNKIEIKAGKNAKIQGKISGSKSTKIDVKGDLSIESTQDKIKQYWDQKQIGLAFNAKSVSCGSRMTEHTIKKTQETCIESHDALDINVEGNLHLKGAIINNNDKHPLKIKSKSMTNENLKNTNHILNTGFQANIGFENTTINATDIEKINESITNSTIDKGEIQLAEGSSEGLNRNIESIEKVTRKEIVSDTNLEISFDNKLFTKKGRKEIYESYANLAKNLGTVAKHAIFNPITNEAILCIEKNKPKNE